MEDRIIELLGSGVPPSVVATTVGCDPSYISQLMDREEVAARVAELRAEKAAEHIQHDENIHDLEKMALERIGKLLPMQTDLMKVTKVFQVLNSAKKSSDHGVLGNSNAPGTIVTLELPAAAHVTFKLTPDKQVVEVQGRSMVPMPSHMVAAKLREKKAQELLDHSKDVPLLPTVSKSTRSIIDML